MISSEALTRLQRFGFSICPSIKDNMISASSSATERCALRCSFFLGSTKISGDTCDDWRRGEPHMA